MAENKPTVAQLQKQLAAEQEANKAKDQEIQDLKKANEDGNQSIDSLEKKLVSEQEANKAKDQEISALKKAKQTVDESEKAAPEVKKLSNKERTFTAEWIIPDPEQPDNPDAGSKGSGKFLLTTHKIYVNGIKYTDVDFLADKNASIRNGAARDEHILLKKLD